jgi:hypothetical protein
MMKIKQITFVEFCVPTLPARQVWAFVAKKMAFRIRLNYYFMAQLQLKT